MNHRFAVITAAGSSRRMGNTDKLLLPLAGAPLLIQSLRCFMNPKEFVAVALSVSRGREEEFRELLQLHYPEFENTLIVAGGKERQDSIRLALLELQAEYSPSPQASVLIHDGARPFVSGTLLAALHEKLDSCDGVIPATPVRDTIKRVNGHSVIETEDRETLRMVQTPQAFRFSKILQAHLDATDKGFIGTDDASLIERMGGQVTWIDGPVHNLKITVPDDIILMQEISRQLQQT